ncbi:nucleic acid-binding protein, partial [Natronococcus sp. JC468]|uniref:nucleic acid-binding protein n=1 Tax=Natronococcus sp. JC468 TaxID=1961921 RepID=UPI00143A9F1E
PGRPSPAPPPGARDPTPLAIVESDVGDALETSEREGVADEDAETSVRALVQLTDGDVETGDEVEPVYTEELREPGAGIREPASQDWDGYRFEPV